MACTSKTVSTCTDDLPKDECPICLEEMEPGQYAYIENCRHYFHKDCLIRWFNEEEYTCPVCRADYNRVLLWPKAIESEGKKKIIFELQKQCFGLFNISPQTEICLTYQEDMVRLQINEAYIEFKLTTEDQNSTYRYKLPELDNVPNLEDLKLQFRMEDCEHIFHTSEQLQGQLTQLRRTGKVVCSTCGTASTHLTLEPKLMNVINENEVITKIFKEQKWCFGKPERNHNSVIEELPDDQFSIRIDGRPHILTMFTPIDILL